MRSTQVGRILPVDAMSDTPLSPLVRDQLHDLRIDPDAVVSAARERPGRFEWVRSQYSEHREAVLLWGGMTFGFVALLGVVLLISALTARPQNGVGGAQAADGASVSLGDQTVMLAAPAFRRLPRGEASITVRLIVQNNSETRAALFTGDLLLANDRGGLFPVTWTDLDGVSRDGVADPKHTLLALEPGALMPVDVTFLTIGGGPFSLRIQRNPTYADAALPTVSLQPSD